MKKELDVVAALIKREDKFLLCQRHSHDGYGDLWEFPGGTVEKGESLPQAIEREIAEELGIKVRAGGLVNEFFDENENLKIKVFLFNCSIQAGTPYNKDCQAFGFFPAAQVEKLDLAPVDRKIWRYLFTR